MFLHIAQWALLSKYYDEKFLSHKDLSLHLALGNSQRFKGILLYVIVLIDCHFLEMHPIYIFNYNVNTALKLWHNYLFLGRSHHSRPFTGPSALLNNIN